MKSNIDKLREEAIEKPYDSVRQEIIQETVEAIKKDFVGFLTATAFEVALFSEGIKKTQRDL